MSTSHKWRNRRWAVLIAVNLLFVVSFYFDIQVLEGALTASRFRASGGAGSVGRDQDPFAGPGVKAPVVALGCVLEVAAPGGNAQPRDRLYRQTLGIAAEEHGHPPPSALRHARGRNQDGRPR